MLNYVLTIETIKHPFNFIFYALRERYRDRKKRYHFKSISISTLKELELMHYLGSAKVDCKEPSKISTLV